MSENGKGRLKRFVRAELGEDQASLFDTIAFGERSKGPQRFSLLGQDGALEGPFNAMLLAPKLGFALQQLGAAIRYSTSLSPRIREAAILMVAARWNCEFERRAHEPLALDAGFSADDVASIASGELPRCETPAERAALAATKAILRTGDITDADFEGCVSSLGEPAIFELMTLVGYYQTLAIQLRVFRV